MQQRNGAETLVETLLAGKVDVHMPCASKYKHCFAEGQPRTKGVIAANS